MKKLFRGSAGEVKNMLADYEGYSYRDNPFDFYIILSRYKFAMRLLKKTHVIGDVGCGKGYGSVFLARHVKEVVALDYDEDLLRVNSGENIAVENLSFRKFDLLKPDVSLNGKFDAIVSMDVIEHFKRDKVDGVIAAYKNLLKDDGFAIIGTPNIASRPFASQRRLATHEFEYTPEEFEGDLAKHFKNVFLFSMTDEIVSTQFNKLSWYLMALCVK
ncbi:class I SAM-dependent methyltransferase [Polynucleobacter paneuropaeus]|nr:class I SAM-dependent methyltransferase [Polynucleobacter paneuropaeus]